MLTFLILNGAAQNQQTELLSFIGDKLAVEKSNNSADKMAQNLCASISQKYNLPNISTAHTAFISKIIQLRGKQQIPTGLAPISNHLYNHAIAATFYTNGNQLKVKNWGCEQAKAQINSILRKLPAAISDFLNCIKKFGWGDAAQIYDKITTLDGFLANQRDPNDPNYKHLDCKEELKRLRSLKQEIASLSDKCN
ncbi:MAG: hypothetical protein AAF927_31600 [Bacteroidota bacterium]